MSAYEIAQTMIGKTIMLTSNLEVRYEGIFCNIDPSQSTIRLSNVRSFGTEGRLKNVPQIPASHTVYEYIVFSGSDIKEIHLIPDVPVQLTPDVLNDSAIIRQSSFPQSAPTFAVTSMPSATDSLLSDTSSHLGQARVPTISQGNILPSYEHFPGFYIPNARIPPRISNLQQNPSLNPQSSVSIPHFTYPWKYPEINPSLSSLAQNVSMSNASLPVVHSSPFPSSSTLPEISTSSVIPINVTSYLSLPMGPTQTNTSFPEITMNMSQNKFPGIILPFVSNSAPNDTKYKEPVLKEKEDKCKEPVVIEKEEKYKEPVFKEKEEKCKKPAPKAIVNEQPMLPHPTVSIQKSCDAAQDPYHNFNNQSKGKGRVEENEDKKIDLSAIDEKFNKQEVWGYLGKKPVPLVEGTDIEKGGSSNSKIKSPSNMEDDFFDDLSNPLEGSGGRNFADQRKLDIESPSNMEDDFFDDRSNPLEGSGGRNFADQRKLDIESPSNVEDDFFDDLSNPLEGSGGRNFADQRKLDIETFGESYNYRSPQSRSGYPSPQSRFGYRSSQNRSGYRSSQNRSGYRSSQNRSGYSSSQNRSGYSSSQNRSDYSSSQNRSNYRRRWEDLRKDKYGFGRGNY